MMDANKISELIATVRSSLDELEMAVSGEEQMDDSQEGEPVEDGEATSGLEGGGQARYAKKTPQQRGGEASFEDYFNKKRI